MHSTLASRCNQICGVVLVRIRGSLDFHPEIKCKLVTSTHAPAAWLLNRFRHVLVGSLCRGFTVLRCERAGTRIFTYFPHRRIDSNSHTPRHHTEFRSSLHIVRSSKPESKRGASHWSVRLKKRKGLSNKRWQIVPSQSGGQLCSFAHTAPSPDHFGNVDMSPSLHLPAALKGYVSLAGCMLECFRPAYACVTRALPHC